MGPAPHREQGGRMMGLPWFQQGHSCPGSSRAGGSQLPEASLLRPLCPKKHAKLCRHVTLNPPNPVKWLVLSPLFYT